MSANIKSPPTRALRASFNSASTTGSKTGGGTLKTSSSATLATDSRSGSTSFKSAKSGRGFGGTTAIGFGLCGATVTGAVRAAGTTTYSFTIRSSGSGIRWF
ncbi:hypothetical protein N9Y81_05135 [Akkermansiaceae bacterium]|nr:hypothetical protein [Akkermansiaceae bacterium]